MELSSFLQIIKGMKDQMGYERNQPRGAVEIPLISRGVEELTCQR